MIDLVISVLLWAHPPQSMCDRGSYYDPSHQICQPNIPGIPGAGYGPDHSQNGWFDRKHGVTAPYPPAYPGPFYPYPRS